MMSTILGVLFLLLRLVALGIAVIAIHKLASRILLSGGLFVLLVSDGVGRGLAWTDANQSLIDNFGFVSLAAVDLLLGAVELLGYVLLLVGFALLSPATAPEALATDSAD